MNFPRHAPTVPAVAAGERLGALFTRQSGGFSPLVYPLTEAVRGVAVVSIWGKPGSYGLSRNTTNRLIRENPYREDYSAYFS